MATPPITYVRHAMPAVEEGADSTEWHLDERHPGARAQAWAGPARGGRRASACSVSSTEPKALETAAAIAERWAERR